ncbi:histidine phosphatase family protein [Alloalcanivorax gelatiniphagus]|uniref:Histidine phosphatase family protein n=1 Tax=Alloalcanivorax gelatiniphagus TaxID=1194167 RepID=A0ABY2XN17_9GAMM|nr:histidine phosphatase family protein [Alloalcanivorax gelatiniphagus]TMW12850.1 histidine phosphatase family protein [Alloalcanivorax gelatiniphagus]
MARLHPRLHDALQLLPAERPAHLLTRHSVRELAKNGFADYRLPLTPEGITMAREWGARLERPVSAFYSSPVGRCVDTARAMAEGARGAGLIDHEPEVITDSTLVEPGCYVEDINRVGPTFLKMGALRFLNAHLRQPFDGMLTPAAGRAKLAGYLHDRQPGAGELAVHVTHDTILAVLVAELEGRDAIDEGHWPWMMEGLWVWFDDRHLNWVWRGEHGRRPFSRA